MSGTTNDDMLLYKYFTDWILRLEYTLKIRKSWFKPIFLSLHERAKKFKNDKLMNLLLTNHADVLNQSKMLMSNPMLDFYKGNYLKAIAKWEEMALLGKQPTENLLKTADLLYQLNCYYELSTFVVWTYTNFDTEVTILFSCFVSYCFVSLFVCY